MKKVMSDVAEDLYEQLTARTFYVVDSEFSTHEGEHHLISIAIVPVVGGRRTKAADELLRVMNPGVPIDDVSSAIHGFTDADVAGKRRFDYYAKVIVERLREDGAVFVCHNTIDAHVLKRELERLDERSAAGEQGLKVGSSHLPDLPIIDTQKLAAAVSYPGAPKGGKLSLDKLCDLTGVSRTGKAHDAREDARATANALIALLRHAAEKSAFWTFDDLLEATSGGTTHNPAGPAHIRSRRTQRAPLPAAHIARHIYPLTDPVDDGSEEAERWLDLAAECTELRCPYLRDEAIVAAPNNASVLLKPLMDDLPHFTEPGQAGTLLGAIQELLRTTPAPGAERAIAQRSALKWWAAARSAIQASTPCDRSQHATSCASCQEGDPCPRDTVYLHLAEQVTLGGGGVLNDARIREILAPTERSALNTWRKHHTDVLAYALWRIASTLLEDGHDERAFTVVDQGIAMNLHTIEPRLTELAGDRLVELGEAEKAFAVAQAVLDQRTTDTAFDDLDEWVLFTQHALYAQQPAPRTPITFPRRARPQGHTNPRLYS